jgi:predicted LPLAT superfamily acyltransferase
MFYRCLIFVTRIFGTWVFDLVAQGIAAGYFCFAPRRVRVGVQFYRALFPQHSRLYALWCTWKQFRNFTSVYLDRYRLQEHGDIRHTSEGFEHIERALDAGTGGIVLMSHLGNWEVAAYIMQQKRPGIPLLLFMGKRAKDSIDRIQKGEIQERGIRVVAVEKNEEAAFDLLEGLRFLQSGGIVSMTGDRVWGADQRAVRVTMLRHEVALPETPHLLAMLSGAPLLIYFVRRIGPKQYHFKCCAPLAVDKAPRHLRKEAIRRSAQCYADLLEAELRANPFEWYHFEPFLQSVDKRRLGP